MPGGDPPNTRRDPMICRSPLVRGVGLNTSAPFRLSMVLGLVQLASTSLNHSASSSSIVFPVCFAGSFTPCYCQELLWEDQLFFVVGHFRL